MGGQMRTAGGGTATTTANNFNNWLNQQLTGMTPQQTDAQNLTNNLSQMNIPASVRNQIIQQINNQANATGAQGAGSGGNTAFQNAFNNAMSGQVQSNSGAQNYIQNYLQNPGANNFSMPSYENPYQSQQYISAQQSQLPTTFGAGQTGMANLNGYGNAALSGSNPFASLGATPTGGIYDNVLQSLFGASGSSPGAGGGFSAAQIGAAPRLQGGLTYEAAKAAVGDLPWAETARQRSIADQRARFGAEGAGALGTGAQFAEATLNADLANRMAEEGHNRALGLMGQDLNERYTGANVLLQGRGQDANVALGNMQGALQGAQNANQYALGNQSALLNAALGARGQNLDTQMGVRNQLLQQQGNDLQQNMFNAGQQNTMQNNMIQAILQNQGLGNAFGLNAAELNNNAMQTNNLNAFNNAQAQNQFNLNNAGTNAQYQMGTNQLNSQNTLNAQQLNNQMLQNILGLGFNYDQLGNQNIQNMIAQLFGGFQQANGLGTPQAQTYYQPSALSQGLNMATQIGGAWLGGGGGNPFGSSTTSVPNLPAMNMNPVYTSQIPAYYGGQGSYMPTINYR